VTVAKTLDGIRVATFVTWVRAADAQVARQYASDDEITRI